MLSKKQRSFLEYLAGKTEKGRRLLDAQIYDVPSARKLLNLGYATFEEDEHVKDWGRGGAPARVLVITDEGRAALQPST